MVASRLVPLWSKPAVLTRVPAAADALPRDTNQYGGVSGRPGCGRRGAPGLLRAFARRRVRGARAGRGLAVSAIRIGPLTRSDRRMLVEFGRGCQGERFLAPEVGALRAALIERLTTLTARQLGYWHRTGLLRAHADPGARGYPRLYTWPDYLKLRTAAKLRADGVPTRRIRRAVDYLEALGPEWHNVPLRAEGRSVLARLNDGLSVAADLGGQIRLDEELARPLGRALAAINGEGPLGRLRAFSDAVDMHPNVRAGAPVLYGTRIETALVRSLRNDLNRTPTDIASAYKVSEQLVRRAIRFENAAA